MWSFLFGVFVGAIGAWVYGSKGAQQTVTSAPVTRQLQERAAQATAAVRGVRAGRQAPGAGQDQPTVERPLTAFVDNPVPDDVQAEQDAAARAAADALRDEQAGA